MDLASNTLEMASSADAASSSPGSQLMRHPMYYLEDGNIHITFEDKWLFRLYRGHLARHSLVFRDMVSLSQAPEYEALSEQSHGSRTPSTSHQEYLDGAPVIRLDDRAQDFAFLLDVILGITPSKPSFEMLEGVLRISTKYLFDEIRPWAVEHIIQRFPTTLTDLLADPTLDVYGDRTLAAHVVALAREFDLDELIPLALYSIVSYNFSKPPTRSSPLFSPQSSPTIGNATPHSASLSPLLQALSIIRRTLPPADLSRWSIGRLRLEQAAVDYLFQLREYGLMKISCSRKVGLYQRTCAAGNVHSVWAQPQPAMAEFLRDPLGVMAVEGKAYDYSTMCGDCNAAGQAKHIELVKELFGKLDDIFMLNDKS
ncbi:hypothetical protein FRB99_005564, partial [Tulasnella sp. 403]